MQFNKGMFIATEFFEPSPPQCLMHTCVGSVMSVNCLK